MKISWNFQIVCILLINVVTATVFSQPPRKINYQAIVRNNSGNPVAAGTTVSLRFTISDKLTGGTVLYQETHSKTTDNNFGLVTLEIGGGTKVSGTFPTPEQWAAGDRFIKVEADVTGGSVFTEMASFQLLSVPYALVAGSSMKDGTQWNLSGNSSVDSATQFIGTADDRSLSFRTNNQGRMLITSNGFVALGNPVATHPLTVKGDAMIDSVYIGRGKFRFFSNLAIGVGSLNSNGIGAFNLQDSKNNTGVGYKSLFSNTTGYGNTGQGTEALFSNTKGIMNTAQGAFSLYSNAIGIENTAQGYRALYSLNVGGFNTAQGSFAMNSTTLGEKNTAQGHSSLSSNTTGSFNTAQGSGSMSKNISGTRNTAQGWDALYSNTTGFRNTAVGAGSLSLNTTGDHNTAVGYNAGVSTGNLRYSAAFGANSAVSLSRTMSFGREDSVVRWSFGRSQNSVGALQVGTTSANGNGAYLSAGGTWTNTSDVNLKSNISPLSGAEILEKVKQLEITRWSYTGTDEYHIGPMAQQFHSLFNVGVNNTSISTVDPAGVALKAIQEQQRIIEDLTAKYLQLQKEFAEFRANSGK